MQKLTACCAGSLDVPMSVAQRVQTKLIGDLCRIHGVGKILLIGEHEKKGVTELIFVEHPLELLACFRYTLPIVGVDDEDDTLRVLEVYTVAMGEKDEGREDTSDAEDVQCLQRGRILSCPPTSQTVNEMFLYSTVSTLKPV